MLAGTSEEVVSKSIKGKFPGLVLEAFVKRRGRVKVSVKPEGLHEVARYLKEELGFDHVITVSGVDYPPPANKMELIYFLGSYSREDLCGVILLLKADLPRDDPKVPSLASLWPSALYHERETWEMFGIHFEGHPRLEKLFLRDNWEGPPPLRKDLKIPEMG